MYDPIYYVQPEDVPIGSRLLGTVSEGRNATFLVFADRSVCLFFLVHENNTGEDYDDVNYISNLASEYFGSDLHLQARVESKIAAILKRG